MDDRELIEELRQVAQSMAPMVLLYATYVERHRKEHAVITVGRFMDLDMAAREHLAAVEAAAEREPEDMHFVHVYTTARLLGAERADWEEIEAAARRVVEERDAAVVTLERLAETLGVKNGDFVVDMVPKVMEELDHRRRQAGDCFEAKQERDSLRQALQNIRDRLTSVGI